MVNKEKLKDNYEYIISNIERRMDKKISKEKLYRKLRNGLGLTGVILLPFVWPAGVVSLLGAGVSLYKEKEYHKEYISLIDKLEDANTTLMEINERESEERKEEKKEYIPLSQSEILNILYEQNKENHDNKVYRKR